MSVKSSKNFNLTHGLLWKKQQELARVEGWAWGSSTLPHFGESTQNRWALAMVTQRDPRTTVQSQGFVQDTALDPQPHWL